MSSPGVEVGSVGLYVLVVGAESVRVEYEFVWGEEEAAHGAFDAFSSGRVVPRW